MISDPISERVRVSIELALMEGPDDPAAAYWQQYADAKRLGMSEAEIDIARQGRSFDVQTASAQAVAIAALSEDEAIRAAARARAKTLGLCEATCQRIEAFARRFLATLKLGAPGRA